MSRGPTRVVVFLAGLFLVLGGPGCESESALRFLELSVFPEGSVARCQEVVLRFRASAAARYSLTSGDRVILDGITWGAREERWFRADRLGPSTGEITVTLTGEWGTPVIEHLPLSLDQNNTAPIARPRLEGDPLPSAQVVLDGTLSHDPDGDELEHAWRFLDTGLDAALEGGGSSTARLRLPPEPGLVEMELEVSDPWGATDRAILSIPVVGPAGNTPPLIRSPGPGFELIEASAGRAVEIRVDATDADNDELEYTWRQLGGPWVVRAAREGGALLGFPAPGTPALVALELVVSDGLHRVPTRVEVSVDGAPPDRPPVPAIDPVERPATLAPIRLSARGTTDPDSEDLWYEWTVLHAPAGSLLEAGGFAGSEGWGASEVTLSLDRSGIFQVGLRVADGLGFAPEQPTITLIGTMTALQLHRSPVTQLTCQDGIVAWAGPAGVGVRTRTGAITTLSPTEASSLAIDPTGRYVWFDGIDPDTDLWALARVWLDAPNRPQYVALPLPATLIHDMIVDPAPSRLGDVIVGTDQGTAILDIMGSSCASELGCWVGSGSTGYVHRPPSLYESVSIEVRVLAVEVNDEGFTVVHQGNGYWLLRLVRQDDFHRFTHTAIDLFDDEQPQPILALARAADALYMVSDPSGLVERRDGGDCGFVAEAPDRCGLGGDGACGSSASVPPPGWIVDIAGGEAGLFIAAMEGFFHYSPALSRFVLLQPEGAPVAGTPSAVATCGGIVYLATDQGLWQMTLEGSD